MLPALHPFCTTLLKGSEIPAGRKEAVNKLFPRKSLFLTLKACWGGMQREGTKCDLNKGHHSFTKNCSFTQNSQQLGSLYDDSLLQK